MPLWLNALITILVFFAIIMILKIIFFLMTPMYSGMESLEGKTAVITGGHIGIGLETAKNLARRGARVIIVCKEVYRGHSARVAIESLTRSRSVFVKHIDFAILASIRLCAEDILSTEPRIDILINNFVKYRTDFELSQNNLEKLTQLNYFGPFLLTNLLLGRIKESAPSRIINVSSILYKLGDIDLNHMKRTNRTSEFFLFCDTKLANIYFSNELARRLVGTGVTSNSLNPGIIATDIARDTRGSGVLLLMILTALKSFYRTEKEGAQTQIYAACNAELENVTGCYFSDCKISTLSEIASDMNMAKSLWELSEEAVRLKPEEKHY